MKYDMVMFDIDGTIWDVSNILVKTINDTLKENDIIRDVTHADVTKALGYNFIDFSNHVLYFIDDEDLRFKLLRESEIKKFKLIDEMGAEPYPNFRKVLKNLSTRYKIGIVSNCGPDTIEQLIKVLDINSYVTDFVAASKFKITKGEAIKRVAKNNNANHYVYVGDTVMDQKACEEANSDFIHARYGFGKDVKAEYYIDSFDELSDTIKKMEDDNG